MTADVVTIHGEAVIPPAPESPVTDLAKYFRGVADMLDHGQIDAISASVVMGNPKGQIIAQVVGATPLEGIALLAIGQRILGG